MCYKKMGHLRRSVRLGALSSGGLYVTIMALVVFIELQETMATTQLRHVMVGGNNNAHCDMKGFRMPRKARVKSISIRSGKDTVYYHGAYAYDMHTAYTDRWHIYVYGIETDGRYLKVESDFNITISMTHIEMQDAGKMTCRLVYEQPSRGSLDAVLQDKELMTLDVHESGEHSLCKNSWIFYNQTKKPLCMRAFFDEQTWDDARAECRDSHHGDLVISGSAQTDDFLNGFTGLAKGSAFWIGMTNREDHSKFFWITGGVAPNYRKWHGGKPGSSGHCVEKGLMGMGTWSVMSCDEYARYICQRDTGAETTSWSFYFTLKFILLVVSIICLIVLMVGGGYAYKSKRANKIAAELLRKLRKLKRRAKRTMKRRGAGSGSTVASQAAGEGYVFVVYDSELNEIVEEMEKLETTQESTEGTSTEEAS